MYSNIKWFAICIIGDPDGEKEYDGKEMFMK